jgi:pilus assembly protein Flp/PilA
MKMYGAQGNLFIHLALSILSLLRGIIMLYRPQEEGQGLVEYALILVLVAVVVIVTLAIMGPSIANAFENVMIAMTPYIPS